MENKRIDITIILGWMLGILVFLRTMPVYLWTVEDTIRPICTILVMLICVTNISKERGTFWIFLFLAASYIWAVVFVDHSGIITLLNFMTFAIIPITRKDLVMKAYKAYRSILVVVFVLSIIVYILWLFDLAGVGEIIDPLNNLKTHKYLKYPFMVTSMDEESKRFRALFDEPGVVGTICGLILVSEQMNMKKLGNWVFLVAGLISFSFYFYVALVVGVLLFSTKLKFRWLIVPVFAGALLVSYYIPYIYDTVWSRFEWDADKGWFVGDNRNADDLAEHYESIVGTKEFFTGEGSAVAKEYNNSASLNLIIVKHGFIFVFLNLMGFAILSFREIRNKILWISFFVFFVLTLYQRPGFYGVYSISLYTMVIYNFGMNAEKLSGKLEMEKKIKEEKRKKRRLKRKKRFQLRIA
jgi:hypothetical protein